MMTVDPLTKYRPYSPVYDETHHPLKLIIIMVGLPARGKSYLSKQLTSYLRDQNLDTEIFNVGNTRRAEDGAHDASFFSSSNIENVRLREKFALDTLHELMDWLYVDNSDRVGIFDATNSTIIRRVTLLNAINTFDLKSELFKDTEVLFLENIVDDEHIIHSNIISKLMLSPDYNDLKGSTGYDSTTIQGGQQVSLELLNQNQIEAYRDFEQRLKNYESVYETIDTEELAILRIGKNNNNNIKMIKLYNYGGTFMRPGNISLYNVTTSMRLLQSKRPKQLSSTRDYVSKILEFLLGYRYEYSTPPETEEVKRNRINYHTVLCK